MSNNDERERTMTLSQRDIIETRTAPASGLDPEADIATIKLREEQLDALIGRDEKTRAHEDHEPAQNKQDGDEEPTQKFVLEASIMSHLSNPLLELPPPEEVGQHETTRMTEGVLKRTIAAAKQEDGIGGEGATQEDVRELKTPNALPSRPLNPPPNASARDEHTPSSAPDSRPAPREETVRVEFSNAEARPLPNAGLEKTRNHLLYIGIGGLALTLGGLLTVLLFMIFR